MKTMKYLYVGLLVVGMNIHARSPLREEWPSSYKEEHCAIKENNRILHSQNPYYLPIFPDKEERSKTFYTDVAIGFMKYCMPSTTITNRFNYPDAISKQHGKGAPLVRAGFGVALTGAPSLLGRDKTTNMRLGIQVLYAKRSDAITTFYTTGQFLTAAVPPAVGIVINPGSTFPDLRGVQSIKRGEFMAVMSYDILRDIFALEGGLGLVGGALTDLVLYQPASLNATSIPFSSSVTPGLIPIGVSLKANPASFGGFVGFTLSHRFEMFNDARFELGYRSVFNSVSYKRRIYQTVPDPSANTVYQTAYATAQTSGPFFLPASPSMKVRAQQCTLGMVIEF